MSTKMMLLAAVAALGVGATATAAFADGAPSGPARSDITRFADNPTSGTATSGVDTERSAAMIARCNQMMAQMMPEHGSSSGMNGQMPMPGDHGR
jgi:hypothetical protein